jgi:hypothetical protein
MPSRSGRDLPKRLLLVAPDMPRFAPLAPRFAASMERPFSILGGRHVPWPEMSRSLYLPESVQVHAHQGHW